MSLRSARRTAAAVLLALTLAIAGCTANGGAPDEKEESTTSTPDEAAASFATALANRDLASVEISGTTGADANTQLELILDRLGADKPTVKVSKIDTADQSATATLDVGWPLVDLKKPWTYQSTLELTQDDGQWLPTWSPASVHPDLDQSTGLVMRRTQARRGEITGAGDKALVAERDVARIGIDKTRVSGTEAETSAAKLAKLVDVDAAAFVKRVKAAGAQAFVEAIVIRTSSDELPSDEKIEAIKGAVTIADSAMLAQSRTFARAILGSVGAATKELVDESEGKIVAGDQVGVSGLQHRYDEQLRGTPGIKISVAALPEPASPSPSPSSATPSDPSPSAAATPADPVTVHEVKPVNGKALKLSLDDDLQTEAEALLAGTKPASAIVAIKPSTGAILAAANGPGAADQSVATVGQYAPGSTFKIVSALALLRSGMKPATSVKCPNTVTVDGRKFKNYDDYPASAVGTIDLKTAIAQSCNTAMINSRGKASSAGLTDAAASLGLGTDYDVGFPSFFGSVPGDKSETGHAAAMIGQGKVLASPMSMAAVAASVSAGKTVVPSLVDGQAAKSKADPLSKTEAKQLQQLMRGVVESGSGRFLSDVGREPIGAKTGTAEYGTDDPLKTHAWMIAFQGDLAVAVFVGDGESGSETAGPLLEDFLNAAG